jgi:hypothetical protein
MAVEILFESLGGVLVALRYSAALASVSFLIKAATSTPKSVGIFLMSHKLILADALVLLGL